jgi:uncharacterized protein (TIGR02270 family)
MVELASIALRVVEQHHENAAFLWNLRDNAARVASIRLIDLVRMDERVEANVDGLRVGGEEGWRLSLAALDDLEAGAFFTAAVLAIESDDAAPLEQLIKLTLELAGGAPNNADHLWRGFASALAWVEASRAANALDRLIGANQARLRWVAIVGYGLRRAVQQTRWEPAVEDRAPLVRARANRTAGQLGRADLVAQLRPGLTDDDPECRFWSAWAAARMGARGQALDVLADIAWNNQPRAVRALDLLLRRLDVPQANAWLREFAKLPGRQRDLIRAAGVIGDPLYIPWLIERMAALETTRLAGEAFSMITGLDLAYRDLDRKRPQDFESGPNDDPADENVSLDDDEHLPWPDPEKIGQWWSANRGRFNVGTAYFLGAPKPAADLLQALSDAYQRQRHAAALELAIRQPDKAMFEVRARGRLQRQLLAGARGKS